MTDHGIAQRLAGGVVLITGVTGFVGEALLHRLLTQVPDVTVVALVRPRGSTSGAERIRTLLGKPIFAGLGDVEDLLQRRVRVLEGDMADVPELPADLTAVVHCAGDVSFDPPVDTAFITNVAGTRDLLARVAAVGAHVHYVHVSTAYVAGRRRGIVLEGPVEHDVDVDAETAWGLAQRPSVEARSRDADRLAGFRREEEREHRRAGLLTAAAGVEERRRAWVRDELVRLGTERARSLGWTDCYTFTKALGERVIERHGVEQHAGPVTILRPSIIESAVAVPHPGWIEGFKMAEPLILAYGRGEIPDITAPADTAIDIVPIDHVVAATVAALAFPPTDGTRYLHVASSGRNPLPFGRFVDAVRRHFVEHPMPVRGPGAARLPIWRYTGGARVERRLATGERLQRAADRALSYAPRSERVRTFARTLDEQSRRLEFLRRYLDLYGEYVVADLRFDDATTTALFASLSDEDREAFAFDTAAVEWDHYIADVHCPAVTRSVRRIEAARARRRASPPTVRPATAARGNAAAFFDLDGTLMSSNVVETYLWSRLPGLGAAERLGEIGRIAGRVPSLVQAERRGREDLLRTVYEQYRDARLAELEALVDDELTDHVLARLAPGAVRRVREHRAAGQPTVLITGAVRPLTRPLAPLFDHVVAVDLDVDDRGVCTGRLAAPPLVGESRAAWIRAWARRNDVDLGESFAYADSYSDLPMLAAVGHPAAVRPDVALARHARRKHWPVVDWASPATASRSLNPAGHG